MAGIHKMIQELSALISSKAQPEIIKSKCDEIVEACLLLAKERREASKHLAFIGAAAQVLSRRASKGALDYDYAKSRAAEMEANYGKISGILEKK